MAWSQTGGGHMCVCVCVLHWYIVWLAINYSQAGTPLIRPPAIIPQCPQHCHRAFTERWVRWQQRSSHCCLQTHCTTYLFTQGRWSSQWGHPVWNTSRGVLRGGRPHIQALSSQQCRGSYHFLFMKLAPASWVVYFYLFTYTGTLTGLVKWPKQFTVTAEKWRTNKNTL